MGSMYIETPYISNHRGPMYIEIPYEQSHEFMYIDNLY